MSEIVAAVMACFMVLGAADKALFSGRLGYGEEFEKGLGAMGPLSMSMVGIMCAAPSIGAFLGPALTPFFTAIGSDPSVAACMVLGVDSGGLPLALALAKTHEAAMLSGLGLGGSFGCIMTFALPISLSICSEESRPDVARGLVAGIIAAPFSLFTVAAVMGYGFGDVLRLGLPAFAVDPRASSHVLPRRGGPGMSACRAAHDGGLCGASRLGRDRALVQRHADPGDGADRAAA